MSSKKRMRIPEKQLRELGFIEISDNLFMKKVGSVALYRDYRGFFPTSYAYKKRERVSFYYKEFEAIEKIERSLEFMRKEGRITSYAM